MALGVHKVRASSCLKGGRWGGDTVIMPLGGKGNVFARNVIFLSHQDRWAKDREQVQWLKVKINWLFRKSREMKQPPRYSVEGGGQVYGSEKGPFHSCALQAEDRDGSEPTQVSSDRLS